MGQVNQPSPEIVTAFYAFTGFWLVLVLFILLVGRYLKGMAGFRQQLVSQWKPALLITALYSASMGLAGKGWLNPYAIAIFCQAIIGLAIISGIQGFQALPVAQAVKERHHILLQVGLLLVTALLVTLPAILIGTVGMSIGRQIFGEVDYTQQAASTLFTGNKWLVFFSALGGAGIAEETTYRLVVLSLVWKLTGRSWLAVIVSALVFGAYHLTPLNGMYLTFLKFPISQFLGSVLIGLIWGTLFVKRGFGTAVLGHALSDWLPLLLFVR